MTSLYELFQKPLEERLLLEGDGTYYFYPEIRYTERTGLKVELIGWYGNHQQKGIALAVKDSQRRGSFTEDEARRVLSFVEQPEEALFVVFFGQMLGRKRLRPVVEIDYKKRFQRISTAYKLTSSTWDSDQSAEQRWTQEAYRTLHQSHVSWLMQNEANRLHLGSLPTTPNILAALSLRAFQEHKRIYTVRSVGTEENFSASISYSPEDQPGFTFQHQLYLEGTSRVITQKDVERVERIAAFYKDLDLSGIEFRMSDLPK